MKVVISKMRKYKEYYKLNYNVAILKSYARSTKPVPCYNKTITANITGRGKEKRKQSI